jgi:DNA-binding beta-propeller fold protein YncE
VHLVNARTGGQQGLLPRGGPRPARPSRPRTAAFVLLAVLLTGCTASATSTPPNVVRSSAGAAPTTSSGTSGQPSRPGDPVIRGPVTGPESMPPRAPARRPARSGTAPGTKAGPSPLNIYLHAGPNMLSEQVKHFPAYAYVPHNKSGDVWVIDQRSHRVVRKCSVGTELQHVVPSFDLRTLYATSDQGNRVLLIDPATGKCGRTIPVLDPYNMYFTPDGRSAISVAEARRELVWYTPTTFRKTDSTALPGCAGVDHADFSADGRTAVFTCEFAGRVAVVDVRSHRLLRMVDMPVRNLMMGPQDIKLAPDAHLFYIADSEANGVWVLNGAATSVVRFIPTGRGAHGLYLSRDSRRLFVTNRLEGSISVLDAANGTVETKWRIPGGGSPDMGNVSADGSQLWVSGRYHKVVYVLSTSNGRLLAKIPVGDGPHGMALMPIPGRYSLGHTGITR